MKKLELRIGRESSFSSFVNEPDENKGRCTHEMAMASRRNLAYLQSLSRRPLGLVCFVEASNENSRVNRMKKMARKSEKKENVVCAIFFLRLGV